MLLMCLQHDLNMEWHCIIYMDCECNYCSTIREGEKSGSTGAQSRSHLLYICWLEFLINNK